MKSFFDFFYFFFIPKFFFRCPIAPASILHPRNKEKISKLKKNFKNVLN